MIMVRKRFFIIVLGYYLATFILKVQSLDCYVCDDCEQIYTNDLRICEEEAISRMFPNLAIVEVLKTTEESPNTQTTTLFSETSTITSSTTSSSTFFEVPESTSYEREKLSSQYTVSDEEASKSNSESGSNGDDREYTVTIDTSDSTDDSSTEKGDQEDAEADDPGEEIKQKRQVERKPERTTKRKVRPKEVRFRRTKEPEHHIRMEPDYDGLETDTRLHLTKDKAHRYRKRSLLYNVETNPVTYVCVKGEYFDAEGERKIKRGCAEKSNRVCSKFDVNEDCFVCDTDECNSAFTSSPPIVLIISSTLLCLLKLIF